MILLVRLLLAAHALALLVGGSSRGYVRWGIPLPGRGIVGGRTELAEVSGIGIEFVPNRCRTGVFGRGYSGRSEHYGKVR